MKKLIFVKFIDPNCSIISNYDASVNYKDKNIINNLKLQMSNKVVGQRV